MMTKLDTDRARTALDATYHKSRLPPPEHRPLR